MTPPAVSALRAARDVLAFCVLRGCTLRVVELVPEGPARIAVHPAGSLPPDLRATLALPRVRAVVAQHMAAGATRFGQGDPAVHSLAATAAGFAHLAICLLTPNQKDVFSERAAVRQYDGGLPRQQAELLGLFDTLDHASTIEAVAALCGAA